MIGLQAEHTAPELKMLTARIIVAMAMFLTGCGTQEHSNKQPVEGTTPVSDQAEPAATSTTNPVEHYSFLAASKAALPACDDAHQSELAYAKAEKAFYACDGSAWAQIDIQGAKGEKGDDGAPAETLSANVWLDPVTDIKWTTMESQQESWELAAKDGCSNKWRLPTPTELHAAIFHGIPEINVHYIWTQEGDAAGKIYWSDGEHSDNSSSTASVFCIEKS